MIFDLSNYRLDFQIVSPLCSLEFCNKVLAFKISKNLEHRICNAYLMFGGESEHLPEEKK